MIETYAQLAKIRRSNSALSEGSLRFVYASDEAIVYVREDKKQAILVAVTRGADKKIVFDKTAVPGIAKAENIYGDGKITLNGADAKLPGEPLSVNIWRLPATK